MNKFYTKVVSHPKIIIEIFLLLSIISIFLKNLIIVNYDMNDYLPTQSPSTKALDLMNEEFSEPIPNARVMIKKISIPKSLEYKKSLEKIEGVTNVSWLDDAVNIYLPLESIDKKNLKTYYKDSNALYILTLEDDKKIEAVEEIRNLIGPENSLTGNAVSTADATTSTVEEIKIITVLAVSIVLIILLFSTESWFEPLVILIGLGVAIAINAGTNLIFREISFVTNSAGNILQLGVSLDYSIFLMHRFEEIRNSEKDIKKAMVKALSASTSSIISSGITTVIGFLALCLMKFQIGPDLGLALSKGILISLITVFIFMPNLILLTSKLIDKTRHKSFMPTFENFGKLIYKLIIPSFCLFILIILPANLASKNNDYYFGSSHILGPESRIGRDVLKINEIYGESDTYVLLIPKGFPQKEAALSRDLKEIPEITNIISYRDTIGPSIPEDFLKKDDLEKLASKNYRRYILTIKAPYEGEKTFNLVEEIRSIIKKYYPHDGHLAGEGISTYDLKDTITRDMKNVNLIVIISVYLAILFTSKSLIVPALLVLAIETAIWINFSIPYFKGSTIFYIAYLIISSIQLGATVDYAILFSDRYRDERKMKHKKDALIATVSSTCPSILTSAGVLTIVGFLLGNISSHGILSQLGFFLGKGTIFSFIIVFFVLPSLLYVFDKFVVKKGVRYE